MARNDDRFVPLSELYKRENEDDQEHFLRFLPDGSVAKRRTIAKAPEIPPEELHRRRMEKLEREAFQRAFENGERAGLEMGEQKAAILTAHVASILQELQALPGLIFQNAERFLVEVAIGLVRELLKHELSVNPEGIAERVSLILKEAGNRERIALRLNPQDAELMTRFAQFEGITFLPDPAVHNGSVILESAFGGIEDDLQTRLNEAEAALREVLGGRLDKLEAERRALLQGDEA